MKLKDLYKIIISEGIKTDLRSKEQIRKFLGQQRKDYNKLKPSRKKFFDRDRLTNPYSDTRILYGGLDKPIRRVMVGIDMEVSELILADYLGQRGESVDLVLTHHPAGIALAGLDEVMHMQTDMLANLGIDYKVAKSLMKARISRVSRGLHGANHTRSVDAARLLGIPFMCCHTPADNHVARYLQRLMDKQKPKTLDHVIDLLLKEPEYQDAMKNKAGPRIVKGTGKDKAGRIVVDMTGGTEGAENIYARLSQLGINTYLGMHLSENHFQKLKTEYINLIIAGHMASDNLGMNLLLDKIQPKAKIEIIACSGFRRVER